MKRITSCFAILLLCAGTLLAGVTYEFKSVTDGRGGVTMAGTASLEGSGMRMDFREGDDLLFKDKGIVLSNDGGKTLIVLDPAKKTYYELELAELFKAMGSMVNAMGGMFQMSVDNQKVDVRDGGAGEAIEGYATRRYVVHTSYDLNMKIMGMKSSSAVEMTTESWTTDEISPDYATFVQTRNLRTGMESLDKLLEAQTGNVKGFPLKQVTTMKTTQGNKSQTQTTTVTVTKIQQKSVPASSFEVPAGYSKGESPLAAMEALKAPR